MEKEEDFTSLGLIDQINHKSWKARILGYETIANNPPLKLEMCWFKKITKDPNQVALEAGLLALLSYVKTLKTCSDQDWVADLADKALMSTRALTRTRALEILNVYVQSGSVDLVMVSYFEISTNERTIIAYGIRIAGKMATKRYTNLISSVLKNSKSSSELNWNNLKIYEISY
jgi:hypothetical protein